MGEDKRNIMVCDEDILNIKNAIGELIKLAYTDNHKEYIEIFTLKSIIKRYENADKIEYQIRNVLACSRSIIPAIKKARELMGSDLLTAKNYVDFLLEK